jgi:hypothetical protein
VFTDLGTGPTLVFCNVRNTLARKANLQHCASRKIVLDRAEDPSDAEIQRASSAAGSKVMFIRGDHWLKSHPAIRRLLTLLPCRRRATHAVA